MMNHWSCENLDDISSILIEVAPAWFKFFLQPFEEQCIINKHICLNFAISLCRAKRQLCLFVFGITSVYKLRSHIMLNFKLNLQQAT